MGFKKLFFVFLTTLMWVTNLHAGTTAPAASPPGEEPSIKSKVLEAGAAILQNHEPLDAMNEYLDAFHFHNGDTARQVEAHHYCGKVNEDLTQCVIFNGNGSDALLMGVEYIISERLFKGLPEEEKKLWHSHVYEVKSGQLIMPGVPNIAEHEAMEKLVSTYGKTWHTWHLEQPDHTLPLGFPALMMAFTADGQIDREKLKERDRRFDVSTEDKRKNREDIPTPAIQPGADSWEKGEILQLELKSSRAEKKPAATVSPQKP
jgi:hypothetical protein